MTEDLKQIIESLLFVSEAPLSISRIKTILVAEETDDIREALETLFEEYQAREGGFYLKEIAGGYQFRTRPEYNTYIRRMLKPNAPRLSKAALETLAIIAYKQPVIRSDVEHVRGVDSGGVLRLLLERKLIRILGRKEIPGRPLIYATTKLFLEVFDLKDLKDLPTPKEIEEMSRAPGEMDMPGSDDALEFSSEPPETEGADPGVPEDGGDGTAQPPEIPAGTVETRDKPTEMPDGPAAAPADGGKTPAASSESAGNLPDIIREVLEKKLDA